MKASHLALAIILSCAALAAPAGATVTYSVTDLGVLAGGTSSWAYGINDSGQVAGSSQATGGQRATSWTNGTLTALDRIGTAAAQANDLNNSGQEVGYSNNRATIWNGTAVTALGALGGATLSQATGINDSGQIVGYSNYTGASEYHAVLWNGSASSPIDLGTLGGTYSYARDINNSGQIVGVAGTSTGAQRAVVWNGASSPTDLGTLGGASYAYGINDIGKIVGYSTTSGGNQHATLWDNGALTDLNTLSGDSISQAFGINESGQIVGFSTTTNIATANRAVLWENGVASDLNSLIDPSSGWTLRRAQSINESGQIVGYGIYQGQTRAFLLTAVPAAVPEPASWAMMIAGFGLTGAALRRRNGEAKLLRIA